MAIPEPAALSTDDLVTGEAVALDLPPASIGLRIASGLLDVLATIGLVVVLVIVLSVATASTDAALAAVAGVVTIVLAFVALPAGLETLTGGRTLGKLACGLRTVRDDGGPVSFHHAFVRALVGVVEIYLLQGVPAFFAVLLSRRGKRLGDHAAGTYVVRDRSSLRLPPPPPMPWQLAAWADAADITALPPGLALAVRQFLGRAAELDPRSRTEVGARLATAVAAHVAPPPPPGTPAEPFLAAVVAARRDRDAARLRREAELRHRLAGRS
jgi:uncharacterized RDD family membrane protein YckC